jgi:hypothetical protein
MLHAGPDFVREGHVRRLAMQASEGPARLPSSTTFPRTAQKARGHI